MSLVKKYLPNEYYDELPDDLINTAGANLLGGYFKFNLLIDRKNLTNQEFSDLTWTHTQNILSRFPNNSHPQGFLEFFEKYYEDNLS